MRQLFADREVVHNYCVQKYEEFRAIHIDMKKKIFAFVLFSRVPHPPQQAVNTEMIVAYVINKILIKDLVLLLSFI